MIKRHRKQPAKRIFYRTNERIFAHTLRVLDTEGKQIGVLSKFEALGKARQLGLDLVEVAPNAKPPVARIINFNKFLYQQEKKKKEEKKKTKASGTKEVRLSPFIDAHDLEVMIRRAREFLKGNNKVRIVLKFQGRQIVHPEFGRETLNKTIGSLSDISKLEREAHFEGKQLIAILTPEKKGSSTGRSAPGRKSEGEANEEKNQEISKQAV